MKRTFCITMFAVLVALTPTLFAEDAAEIRRQAFVNAFDQLVKNTENGLAKPAVKESFVKDGASTAFEKFNIPPVFVPTTSPTTPTACNLGIKVWFSLEDGTCFNPIKRKMGVKERFYVHIQSAVPIYVALFQNYPESRPESRQVYPDAKYPDTFKVIQAGQATRLPVPFEMDDDTRDEIMSMVVARADAPQIRPTLATAAVSTTTNTGGMIVVTAQATTEGIGTMKSINDDLAGEGMDNPVKFNIAAPSQTAIVTTVVPNDVAFYMFGAGFVGQWQLTLKK